MKNQFIRFLVASFVISLFLQSQVSWASDTVNLCTNAQPDPQTVIDLPTDDSLHFDTMLGYPEYEQYYWNGKLTNAQGKTYSYFFTFFQFTFGDFPFQFPVRAFSIGISDVANKVMHKEFYGDFTSGTPFPLPTEDGHFDFVLENPQTGAKAEVSSFNGNEHWSMKLSDGSSLELSSTDIKNPVAGFHHGFARYCDLSVDPNCDPVTPSDDRMFGHGQGAGDPGYHGEHYYYSKTRMASAGKISINGGPQKPVVGDSWFDRELGTFIKDLQFVWYSIRLDNGEEINMYDIRNYPQPTISRDTFMTGAPILQSATFHGAPPSCDRQEFFGNDFSATFSGGAYGESRRFLWPTDYALSIPALGLDLKITPEFTQQEFFVQGVFLPYWQGISKITGTRNGHPITGHGYVEVSTKCCNGDDGDDLPPAAP